MKVSDMMDSRFQFVGPKTSVREAQELMILRGVNYLIVSETGDRLDGLVTHADMFRRLLPSQAEYVGKAEIRAGADVLEDRYKEFYNTELGSIMTTALTSVKPETPLAQAGALMNAKRVKQLPVLEDGLLLGVISSMDVSAGVLFQSIKR